jgi:uncharacterized membrane protein
VPTTETSSSPAVRIAGLAVAGAGLAHFVAPQAFQSLTEQAFPENTRRHLYTDGAIETALGLGLVFGKTRKAALVGFGVYGAYLAVNVLRNR